MTSYCFLKFKKLQSAWSWKFTLGFDLSNSTRLAMFKSILTPNFDKIAQSTAVLLLLQIQK